MFVHLDVEPKIGGNPPKWMVKIMENPIKMDDLGVPVFLETPICIETEKLRVKLLFLKLQVDDVLPHESCDVLVILMGFLQRKKWVSFGKFQ